MSARDELQDFLTSRRANITPDQAGLPTFGEGSRRVPGLRREEVAVLASSRGDILAINQLGRALFAPLFASPHRPVNTARFVFLDPASHLRTELPLAALEHALWHRRGLDLDGLIHHSDAGSQYLAVRYGERLAEAGIVPSIGSVGDSYDNALAESAFGLFKTELIELHGPWSSRTDLELAVLEYINWFNCARLHGELGHVTPREHEEAHYRHPTPDLVGTRNQ